MMDVVTSFLQSPVFVYSNLAIQITLLFVNYHLGKRRGRHDGRMEAQGLLEAQHSLICMQRDRILIADARIANLEVRLSEATGARAQYD